MPSGQQGVPSLVREGYNRACPGSPSPEPPQSHMVCAQSMAVGTMGKEECPPQRRSSQLAASAILCRSSPAGQQQCGSVSALPRQAQGLPAAAGGHGAAGPPALPARERALQSDHHVRAGVLPQYAEEAGPARRCRQQRRRQLQHTMPQAGLGTWCS